MNNKNSNDEQQKVLIINQGTSYIKRLTKLIKEKTFAHILGYACNLSIGYSMFIEGNPDLIFLSTDLPDGNWIQATAYLKNLKPELKVILISEPLDNFTTRELKQGNIDHCFDKSNDLERVPEIINKMIRLNYAYTGIITNS